ncbi:redoxin domain-containing protein [bacterium]|nr:redoxin domain-containing protein [bacterium]
MVQIGDAAPNLKISEWVQGPETNLDQLRGKVILVEVFQVNCPGCFVYGLPEAIEVYAKHHKEGLEAIGLATAFEDFDKNTTDNLKKLVKTGEVIGEPLRILQNRDWLEGNRLRYTIPFPVAMDHVIAHDSEHVDSKIAQIIEHEIPNFERLSYGEQMRVRLRIRDYVLHQDYVAETFDMYNLGGTPSAILIDRKGFVRYKIFGSDGKMDKYVRELLAEPI